MSRILLPTIIICVTASSLFGQSKLQPVPTYTCPENAAEADHRFTLQGEYLKDGNGIQVAANLGQYHVLRYQGGLPGAGWDGSEITSSLESEEAVSELVATARKQERTSPTAGQEAPEGAIVFFPESGKPDGVGFDKVRGNVRDLLMWDGSVTAVPLSDFELHLEFRLPFKPDRPLSHQDRGNSGIYIFHRYECQVIDSFGLIYEEGKNAVEELSKTTQWCGSFYLTKTPDVPMAFPPLRWQTYDITFRAPRFDAAGKKTENARISVRHNGVLIHDDVELVKGTGAGGKKEEVGEGEIIFQGHGNPVAFRNVWAVKK